ncbi:MAG: hypothetical protein H6733_13260 [Alphaproteobacteria bacterium]|nr:hypothetical protein [Alphaproteobacteria bacterium]
MHPLVRFVLVATPLGVLLFLVLAGFFTAWEGHAVSHRPAQVEDPAVYTVLIVTDDGRGLESDWPAKVVEPLGLSVDVTGVPPNKIPDTAAVTRKSRFATFFTVVPHDGESIAVSTLSARALSTAVMAYVLAFFLHNMWLSGSPFSWEIKERAVPDAPTDSPEALTEAQRKRARSKQGPPPPRPRVGGGRRR